MSAQTSLDIRPIAGSLGAEVHGVDLGEDLSPTLAAHIRNAFVTHHVLVFRDQDLTPEQQIHFGQAFGVLDTHPFVEGNAEYPEIVDVVTQRDDRANFGGGWHTDVTFLDEPDLGSILYAVTVPPVGGDTLFANQHAAYDMLSDTMKAMLNDLMGVHSADPQYGPNGLSTRSKAMSTKGTDIAARTVEHPLIRTHPENGRKGLYVNQAFTIGVKGLRAAESKALLRFLFAHAVQERFTCRVRWQRGSLAMWDNRSVQHHALFDYAGHERRMRRITIKGDRPR